MRSTFKPLLISLFFLLSGMAAFAQLPEAHYDGKITGRIIDSATGAAVEYATVSLTAIPNNNIVNGATADDKGAFTITNVAPGTYKMSVVFFGYKTFEKIGIVVAQSSVVVGDIKIASTNITLKAATISASKPIIENKIDKLVYNVDQDLTSQSGVAADVLKKVPEVTVDVDGNVELQGNSSILFLINGKPSVVYGNNITEVLQSIPSSQIQSIEVITSPGAKYDANGTGGIINIILKKSTAEGINGNVSLSGGTRLENGSFNLNAHHKHFSANAFLSGNGQIPSTAHNTMIRSSYDSSSKQSVLLNQQAQAVFQREGMQTGLGFDWDVTPKDNFSGNFGFNFYGNHYSGTNNRNTLIKDSSENPLSNVNDQVLLASTYHSNALNWGLNYKRKFDKEDQELDLSYISSIDNTYNYYNQTQQYVSPDSIYSGAYGVNPGIQSETDISADYTEPFGENFSVEAGAKYEYSQIISNSGVYALTSVPDWYEYNPSQSLYLNYKSNIYAGYASVKFKLFKWLDVKAGFRYEYTQLAAYYSNVGAVNITPYGTNVPSIMFSHKFQKNQTLKIAYTHRIERPDYGDLNPFINATDPQNLTTGNTHLVPETGDKIELGYSRTFEQGTNLNFTLFYRGNRNDIQPITTYYSSFKVGDTTYNNVAVSAPTNVGREDNYGLSIFASIPITKSFNFRTNTSLIQRYINDGDLPGDKVQGMNYRLNGNFSYEFSKTFVVEAFGNYNSARINVQGTQPGFFSYSFALRKQFHDKKASLAITANNPFNYYVNQVTNLTGPNFTTYNLREIPYQSFGINFTYKFGKLEFKPDKDKGDDTPGPQEGGG
jgi:ferric enterobactin receptor